MRQEYKHLTSSLAAHQIFHYLIIQSFVISICTLEPQVSSSTTIKMSASAPSTNDTFIDIDFCPACAEPWLKRAGYVKCWKCQKSPPSVFTNTAREPDDMGEPTDISAAAVAAKAVKDGQFWIAFNKVAEDERVRN
jgi:hypothetical protein